MWKQYDRNMQEQYDRNMWKNNNGDINIGKNRQEHMQKQTTGTQEKIDDMNIGKNRRQEHMEKKDDRNI